MKTYYGIKDSDDFTLLVIALGALVVLLWKVGVWVADCLSKPSPRPADKGQYNVVVRSVHHGKGGAILTFRIKGDI